MIRIYKPTIVHAEKYVKNGHKYYGIPKWKIFELEIVSAYKTNPLQFLSSDYKFKSGYGEDLFRNELIICQGNKCCYCEKPVHNGQIEHYRPKASCQQKIGEPRIRPGYYFLAYRWSNLYISCGECNASGQKGILFPINGAKRATNLTELQAESPVIIDPGKDIPENHISFNEDIPVKLTERGQQNIDLFKLKDRCDLVTIRRDRFTVYKREKQLLSLGILHKNELIEAKKTLKNAAKFNSPFSGMIRANIKNGIL